MSVGRQLTSNSPASQSHSYMGRGRGRGGPSCIGTDQYGDDHFDRDDVPSSNFGGRGGRGGGDAGGRGAGCVRLFLLAFELLRAPCHVPVRWSLATSTRLAHT